MPQSSRHLRERRNGLCDCLKVLFFLHVRPRESEGTACVVVVSGTRFESFVVVPSTATHVWARTSLSKGLRRSGNPPSIRIRVKKNHRSVERMDDDDNDDLLTFHTTNPGDSNKKA